MSEPAHPSISFRVNLELHRTEAVGPKTNLVNPHILHPSAHQDSPDIGRAEQNNFKLTRSVWLESSVAGGRIRNLKHGDEFTVNGMKALYLRDHYVAGEWNDSNPPGGNMLEII